MKKRAIKIISVTAAAVAAAVALLVFLKIRGLFIPCVFNIMTGGRLRCPACGATRATMRLLTLDFAGAWEYNPMAVFIWLYIIKLYACFSINYVKKGEFIIRRFDWFDIAGAGVIVLWGILRNIFGI